MVYISSHWKEYEANNLALWGFALKHGVWLPNHIPNYLSGVTPI